MIELRFSFDFFFTFLNDLFTCLNIWFGEINDKDIQLINFGSVLLKSECQLKWELLALGVRQ